MKFLIFASVLNLTGNVSGTYTADTINVSNAVGDTLKLCAKVVNVENSTFNLLEILDENCQIHCDDQLTPGIGVLGDSCIRDDEWNGSGYASALPDSASFFEPAAMDFFQLLTIRAEDDCGIDSFFVKELEILPPGGVNPLPGDTKEFRILFRAVDLTGKVDEQEMIWIRNNNGCI